jgi:nicotinate-nucleotide pyrophosphorylase (carboxylating)
VSGPRHDPADTNRLPLPELYRRLAAGGLVQRLLELARDEDLGQGGDVTTRACVPQGRRGRATLAARGGGVVAGLEAIEDLARVFAPGVRADLRVRDGDDLRGGEVLAVLGGPMCELLALERTMLNLVSRLCGVATLTRRYARAIPQGSRARLYDTRKTTPGLRVLEKYAVRCGGGFCHRMGLFDAVLIKDNHLAGVGAGELAEFVGRAANQARQAPGVNFVEVEVDTLEQLAALLTLPRGAVDVVLLDNMDAPTLRRAAEMRDARLPGLELEASGGVTLATIGEIAGTGVDRISVGAITHQAVSLDLGLDVA